MSLTVRVLLKASFFPEPFVPPDPFASFDPLDTEVLFEEASVVEAIDPLFEDGVKVVLVELVDEPAAEVLEVELVDAAFAPVALAAEVVLVVDPLPEDVELTFASYLNSVPSLTLVIKTLIS